MKQSLRTKWNVSRAQAGGCRFEQAYHFHPSDSYHHTQRHISPSLIYAIFTCLQETEADVQTVAAKHRPKYHICTPKRAVQVANRQCDSRHHKPVYWVAILDQYRDADCVVGVDDRCRAPTLDTSFANLHKIPPNDSLNCFIVDFISVNVVVVPFWGNPQLILIQHRLGPQRIVRLERLWQQLPRQIHHHGPWRAQKRRL